MATLDKEAWEKFLKELNETLDPKLIPLFEQRDGAAQLAQALPEVYLPEKIVYRTTECRAWELAGLYYMNLGRPYEALPIFYALYDHMLSAQEKLGERIHKGMPLVFICDCYLMMGFSVLPKRYLMLTLVEDAIREKGNISPDTSGVYFRAVWRHGLPDSELKNYAKQSYDLYLQNPIEGLFPEWILQEMDNNWRTEFPAPQEAAVYSINPRYIRYLITKLGDKSGLSMERLAEYLLSCMPGCKTTRRKKSKSTDYDIVCSMDGLEVDFRSEFGRYFVCECKDWNSPADFTTMAKFCRVLDSTKSRFGILFSKRGISGKNCSNNADREQMKVFQDRGMVIVVVDLDGIDYVANGGNFINLLRSKYECVRLDLTNSESFTQKRKKLSSKA